MTGSRQRRTAVVVVLTVLSFAFTGAQTHGIIEGVVRKAGTDERLAGATVRVVGEQRGAVSDADGQYVVRFVLPGQYQLQVSYLGFRTAIIRGVQVTPGSRTIVDVELPEGSVELAPVEIVASRPLIQKEQGTTTYSIPSEKISTLPVSTVPEILALQPGTTVEGNVRGGKTAATVYAIDGLTSADLVAGGPAFTVPRGVIAGLTVHTGGIEAEYGNAQSGVVNILTRPGPSRAMYEVRFERDHWLPSDVSPQHSDMTEAEVMAAGPVVDGLNGVVAAALHVEDTRWWQDFAGQVTSPVLSEGNMFGRVDAALTPAHRLTGQLFLTRRRWRDYEFPWRYNLAGLPPRGKDGIRAVLTSSWNPLPSMLVSTTATMSWQRSTIGEGDMDTTRFNPFEYDFFLRYIVKGSRDWWADTRQQTIGLRSDISADVGGGHLLKAGADVTFHTLRSDVLRTEPQSTYFGKPVPELPAVNSSYAYNYRPRSGSAYLQDKVQIAGEGSILSVGVRWDWLDPTATRPVVDFVQLGSGEYREVVRGHVRATRKSVLSPRLSYTAPFGERGYVFVNYGHYTQFPLFDYLYGGLHPEQVRQGTRNVQAANPDLEPERTVAWELGVKMTLGTESVGSATYFRKRMLNQIDAKTLIPFDSKSSGNYGFASYVNNAEAEAEGIELVFSKEVGGNLRGSVSYVFMVTEGVSETSDENIRLAQWGFPPASKAYPLSWDQRHTIKVNGEGRIFDLVNADVVLLYHSARPYTFYPTRDGFTPVDSSKVLVPNNARMRDVIVMNVKLTMRLPVGDGLSALLFADVRNAWNTRNVRWFDSNGRVGGELGDPSAWMDPRRVRVGVEMAW